MYSEFNLLDSGLFSSGIKSSQGIWRVVNKYVKRDNQGYESISEVIVSDFMGYVSDLSFVDYSLCRINTGSKQYFGCFSDNFLQNDETCVSFYDILLKHYGSEKEFSSGFGRLTGVSAFNKLILILKIVTHLDLEEYLKQVLLLDAITLNDDRHLRNLFVIKGRWGWRPCPIFDNGSSLLSSSVEYPMEEPVTSCCSRVKPALFFSSFDEQIKLCRNYKLKIDFDRYLQDIEEKTVEFKKSAFQRGVSVLVDRCNSLRGVVWE